MSLPLRAALAAALPMWILVGCAGHSTRLTGAWSNPDYTTRQKIDNILVIGVAPKSEVNRRMFETELATALRQQGVRAVGSLSLMEFSDPVTEESIGKIVKEKKLDAILITRLVDTKRETNYVPSTTYVTGSPYYGSWYGYYGYGFHHGYSVTTTPGYTYTDTIVILETNLYAVEDGTLVWAGTSESFNPASAQDIIKPLTQLIVERLLEDGIVVAAGVSGQ